MEGLIFGILQYLMVHVHDLYLGTCQKLAGREVVGGGGVEIEGGLQLFETAEKGGVVKNGLLGGGGSCKYVSVIT